MLRETLKIFSLLLILTMGCSEAQVAEPPVKEPPVRIYFDTYEKVWRSIQITLRRYPILVNNYDSGILESKFLKGDQVFADPNDRRPKPGYRYKLTLRVVKGQFEGKSAVKVTVLKTAEIQPDFFSGYQSVPSNGLEENAILYRVGRQLEIDRLMEKNR